MSKEDKQRNDLGVSDEELVLSVLKNSRTYELADLIADTDPVNGGRKATYPKYLFIVMLALNDVYRSSRHAFTALHGPWLWANMRNTVASMYPDDKSMHLPAAPPSRTWFIKFRERRVMSSLEELKAGLMTTGIATAEAVGLNIASATGPYQFDDMDLRIAVDGKVLKPSTKYVEGDVRKVTVTDETTGEITTEVRKRRFDPDAKLHKVGDGRQVHGVKYFQASVRGEQEHRAAYLALDFVPGRKGESNSEADVMMASLRKLSKLAPRIVGPNTDGISRGVHLDPMQRELGWTPIAPIQAARVDKKTGDRTEKQGFLRTFTVAGCKLEPVEIWYLAGRLVKRVIDENGNTQFVDLEHLSPIRRENQDGTFRIYVEYKVQCGCGEHSAKLRERTFNNAEDDIKNFKRAENVRAIPPGTPLYKKMYGRRSDAESRNRRIDDHLYLRKARSLGWKRQLLDLIGHAHCVNSLSLNRWSVEGVENQTAA